MSDVLLIPETAAQVLIISETGGGGGGGAVTSVNGKIGAVVLNTDDISDTGAVRKFTTGPDISKLAGIESGATANPEALDNVVEDSTPQLGGDLDCQQHVIQDFEVYRAEITSTTPTAAADDTGRVIEYNHADPITVALPNTLPVGWTITAIQTGDGQVTFAGTATLYHRQSHDSIAGRWGMVTLVCIANNGGSSAVVVLAGDTV